MGLRVDKLFGSGNRVALCCWSYLSNLTNADPAPLDPDPDSDSDPDPNPALYFG